MMISEKPTNVDDYISGFSGDIRIKLEQIRAIITSAAPNAKEVISYNMPAYKQNKVLVYFAGNKKHIGFYPTPAPIVAFKDELKAYKTSKGAIQFPLDKPLPVGLISQIVKYRILADL